MGGRIKVVVAAGEGPIWQPLRARILSEPDMELVSDCDHSDPVALLLTVAESAAHAVIVEADLAEREPGVVSHLLAEHPDSVVAVLPPDRRRAVVFRREIGRTDLSGLDLDELIHEIRRTIS